MPFKATFEKRIGDKCKYRIEETDNEGRLLNGFTGVVHSSQRASAEGWEERSDERKVERWCELNRLKLPRNDSEIPMDLDEVAKD